MEGFLKNFGVEWKKGFFLLKHSDLGVILSRWQLDTYGWTA